MSGSEEISGMIRPNPTQNSGGVFLCQLKYNNTFQTIKSRAFTSDIAGIDKTVRDN
jgi:hypothetical protein